jgi:hypothetical protein
MRELNSELPITESARKLLFESVFPEVRKFRPGFDHEVRLKAAMIRTDLSKALVPLKSALLDMSTTVTIK